MADASKLQKVYAQVLDMEMSGKQDAASRAFPKLAMAFLEGKITAEDYTALVVKYTDKLSPVDLVKPILAAEGQKFSPEEFPPKDAKDALIKYFSSSPELVKEMGGIEQIAQKVENALANGRLDVFKQRNQEMINSLEPVAGFNGKEFTKESAYRIIDNATWNGESLENFDYKKFGLTEKEFKTHQCFGEMVREFDNGRPVETVDYKKFGVTEAEFQKEYGYMKLRNAFNGNSEIGQFDLEKHGFTKEEFQKHSGFIELNKAVKAGKPLDSVDYKKYGISEQEFHEFEADPSTKYPGKRKVPEYSPSELEKQRGKNETEHNSKEQAPDWKRYREKLINDGYPAEEADKHIKALKEYYKDNTLVHNNSVNPTQVQHGGRQQGSAMQV